MGHWMVWKDKVVNPLKIRCFAVVILVIPILDSELKALSDSQLPLQPFFFLLTWQYSTEVVFSAVKFRSLRSMIQLLESNPI